MTFVASSGASTGPGSISNNIPAAGQPAGAGTVTTTGDQINLAAWSKSGTCFFLRDNQSTGTFYGSTNPIAAGTACHAALGNAVTNTSW